MLSAMKRLFGGSSTAIDPVCGMTVDINNPPGGAHNYAGAAHYFCSPGCRLAFVEDPDGFLSGEKRMSM